MPVNKQTTEKTAAKPKRRRDRTKVGNAPRLRLAVPQKIPGHVMRWVNDNPGRLHKAQMDDWDHVTYSELEENNISVGELNVTPTTDELGEKVSTLVGDKENGAPLRAYLMRIRTEWYEENQADKAAEIDRLEAGISTINGVSDKHQYGTVDTS